MDPTVRRLLDSADDPVGTEIPGNDWGSFPTKVYSKEIAAIQQHLLGELGIAMQLDGNVQDASFFDELAITAEEPGGLGLYVRLGIRFSNFGKLATVYSCKDPIPAEYHVSRIIALIERSGWKYVPADVLREPYDGNNAAMRKFGCSWWIRFFDYL